MVSHRWCDHADQRRILDFESGPRASDDEPFKQHSSPQWAEGGHGLEAPVAIIARSHVAPHSGKKILGCSVASAAGLSSFTPILIDCDDATRASRLIVDRQQPELATDDMMNWAAYLRSEALDVGCGVLDTSELSLEQAISYVAERSLSALP